MITGELKNRIDSLWDVFAAGGMVNPLDVIEQITYLMFIHDLDEADTRRVKDNLMLGLPYDSLFDGEYQIGEKTVEFEPGFPPAAYQRLARMGHNVKCDLDSATFGRGEMILRTEQCEPVP